MPPSTNETFSRLLEAIAHMGEKANLVVSQSPTYQIFIQRFPATGLISLSLENYCVGKGNKDSFCRWIERGLEPVLGRYMPGTSRGHILYFLPDGNVYKNSHLQSLPDEEALKYTLAIQSAIANAAGSDDWRWIDEDDQIYKKANVEPRVTIGDARKLRLLAAYHPDEVPPINSPRHIGHFLDQLGTPPDNIPDVNKPVSRMLKLREYWLLARQTYPKLSPAGFVQALYSSEMGIAPQSDESEAGNEECLVIELTDGAIRNGYVRIPKKQSLFPIQYISIDEQPEHPTFNLTLPDNTTVKTYILAKHGRIRARFNSMFAKLKLAEGDRVRLTKTSDANYEMTIESKTWPANQNYAHSPQNTAMPAPAVDLNQILYGPPGTGKTFATIEEALQILDPEFLSAQAGQSDGSARRMAMKSRFDELKDTGRIQFVTFHQSFSYEDFVEGLRASTDDETGQIRYEVVDGIFKSLCVSASAKVTLPTEESTTQIAPLDLSGRRIWKMSLGNTQGPDAPIYEECLEHNIALLGYGGGIDFSGCESRSDVIKRLQDGGRTITNPQNDYEVTAVTSFVTRIKPKDLLVITDGNFKFRAIAEVTGDSQFREHSEYSDGYSLMRPVKWLRTWTPSLPHSELMNNQFSQMTLYELRSSAIDIEKLAALLNTPNQAKTSFNLQPGLIEGAGYKIAKISEDMVELTKPNGNSLAFSRKLIEILINGVTEGKISIEDIRSKQAVDKLQDKGLEPYLVNGYANVLAPLVEQARSLHQTSMTEVNRNDARVLIIDEINRGNVSRIFGELITLIEPTKRQGSTEALTTTLPYSRKPFAVPSNVYILGTMNTADRSLASLDIALRRRFIFKEVPPQPELLSDINIAGVVNVSRLLTVMNQRIEALLDRDHQLGHAYFMPLISTPSLEKLAEIFRRQVLPLLQEYFFEDWERIQWVLNDHRKPAQLQFVRQSSAKTADLFGLGVQASTRPVWEINHEAFDVAEAYLAVIETKSNEVQM